MDDTKRTFPPKSVKQPMLQLDIHTSLAATRVDSSTISPTIVVVPHLNRRENSDSMAVALEEEEGEGAIKKETFIHSDLAQKQHKESFTSTQGR